jgi:hypothetical protein
MKDKSGATASTTQRVQVACFLKAALLITLAIAQSACFSAQSTTQTEEVVTVRETTRKIPGLVEYVWEEPMVDVVEVPPGLDAEGIYYIPPHQTVTEIRQGRYRYLKKE